ncbi:MAG: hypothetical protein IKV03_03670 [Alphaproteobacteria bacterium]|nr:hypothetical protein [Alphaproteobacteria bacterium]
MKNFKKIFENGRTMLEMLAILAIISAIGIGIALGINHGLTVYHASVLQTQLPQIKKAVETVYSFSNNNYSNISRLTEDDYQEMFGDILGENACHSDCDDGGENFVKCCNTVAGSFRLKSIAGGSGFTISFFNMPKGICEELISSTRGDEETAFLNGLAIANTCNEDSKQILEFASLSRGKFNTSEQKACEGYTIWHDADNDGKEECACLNPAITDPTNINCQLPSMCDIKNPQCGECQTCRDGMCVALADNTSCGNNQVCLKGVCQDIETTTTTTKAVIYSSQANDKEKNTTTKASVTAATATETTTSVTMATRTEATKTDNCPNGFLTIFDGICYPCGTTQDVEGVSPTECDKCVEREAYISNYGAGTYSCRLKTLASAVSEPTTSNTTNLFVPTTTKTENFEPTTITNTPDPTTTNVNGGADAANATSLYAYATSLHTETTTPVITRTETTTETFMETPTVTRTATMTPTVTQTETTTPYPETTTPVITRTETTTETFTETPTVTRTATMTPTVTQTETTTPYPETTTPVITRTETTTETFTETPTVTRTATMTPTVTRTETTTPYPETTTPFCNCGSNQYCADTNESCYSSNLSGTCKNLSSDFTAFTYNNKTYYVSDNTISYWDAVAACKALGNKTLVSVSDLIAGWDGTDSTTKNYTRYSLAANDALSGKLNIWTSNLHSDSCHAYIVERMFGYVYKSGRANDGGVYALCK